MAEVMFAHTGSRSCAPDTMPRGAAPARAARRRILVRTALALSLAVLSRPLPAAAAPDAPDDAATQAAAPAGAIAARLGEHAEYGRVVFDVPEGEDFHVAHHGEQVVVTFGGHPVVADGVGHARNVRDVAGGKGRAVITIAPGSRVHSLRLGAHVIVDVLDPVASSKAAAAASAAIPARSAAAAVAPVEAAPVPVASAPVPAGPVLSAPVPSAPVPSSPVLAAPVLSAPVPPVPVPSLAEATATAPVAAVAAVPLPAPGAGPLSLLATRQSPAPGHAGSGLVLPFGPEVGAAAFRTGDQLEVVFDAPRPIDLAGAAGDPVFASARVQVLADTTVLTMPLGEASTVRLDRRPGGWGIVVGDAAPPAAPIGVTASEHTLLLQAGSPGRVVVVADPAGGGVLLVGTQRASGQAVGLARRSPEFTLAATVQGVVVQPASDRVELRSLADGFVVAASGDGGLSLPPASADRSRSLDGAVFTTRFKIPTLPREVLLRRLDDQLAAAAAAPALARFPARYAAAQTMLALGMDAEAQALLLLARRDDPQHAQDPDATGLAAVAALLAGRPGEADGLSLPELTGTDDVALWRAVRDAMRTEGSPDAASVFSADLGLLLSYPEALRNRLLPLAAETMAQAGPASREAARKLVDSLPADSGLAFARALLARSKGDVDGALLAFDSLAQGRDRLLHARAARAATELRLSSGRIDAAQAADALEQQMVAWRGDTREEQVRLRAAELRAQAGDWKAAMALLRDTATLFPEDRAAIGRQVADDFGRLLAGEGAKPLSPLDLVSLVTDNADLLPPGDATTRMGPMLADRLVALDLPSRAGPALERLMANTAAGSPRAEIGARLADMRLEQGDPAAALSALDASAAPGLADDLANRRAMLQARATARQGNLNRAVALLAAVPTAEAADLRARLLADAHDWPGALAALSQLAELSVPAQGALTPAQEDIVLRQAGAAAQAGDDATLHRLQAGAGSRLAAGPRRDLFRLLASAPVQASADLPRAASEIATARTAATGLQAISAR